MAIEDRVINYKLKPVCSPYKKKNMQCTEIDNINANNGVSYISNLSELDKLLQKQKALDVSMGVVVIIHTSSNKSSCAVDNRILASNSLFGMHYSMNKKDNHWTNALRNN